MNALLISKKIKTILVSIFLLVTFNSLQHVFAKATVSKMQKTSVDSKRKVIKKKSSQDSIKFSFFQKIAINARTQFENNIVKNNKNQLDYEFLNLEKKENFLQLKNEDMIYFNIDEITNHSIALLNKLNSSYKYMTQPNLRYQIQLEFYGLSQAIKHAAQLNLSIDANYFDRLHDTLMGQSTALFYASYKEFTLTDVFFTSYYLFELKFPMDLVAKHLQFALNKPKKINYYGYYYDQIAQLSLLQGQQINPVSSEQLQILFKFASANKSISEPEMRNIQKIYLKHLKATGDQDTIIDVKRDLASTLLWEETKNLFRNPLNIFKYMQFLVGYIFIAWPLEFILVFLAVLILAIQSSSVLSHDEKNNLKWHKRLWMMFTRSYLNNNVPFFSKIAVSLVLFGIGLYFNSARNFVETLIGTM